MISFEQPRALLFKWYTNTSGDLSGPVQSILECSIRAWGQAVKPTTHIKLLFTVPGSDRRLITAILKQLSQWLSFIIDLTENKYSRLAYAHSNGSLWEQAGFVNDVHRSLFIQRWAQVSGRLNKWVNAKERGDDGQSWGLRFFLDEESSPNLIGHESPYSGRAWTPFQTNQAGRIEKEKQKEGEKQAHKSGAIYEKNNSRQFLIRPRQTVVCWLSHGAKSPPTHCLHEGPMKVNWVVFSQWHLQTKDYGSSPFALLVQYSNLIMYDRDWTHKKIPPATPCILSSPKVSAHWTFRSLFFFLASAWKVGWLLRKTVTLNCYLR